VMQSPFWCCPDAASLKRRWSRSRLARPHIWRLSLFRRLMWPSTGPFLHDRCLRSTPLKVLTVMDEFTREGLALEVATSLPSVRVLALLQGLVVTHGAPQFVWSDNGPEFIALAVRGWLAQHQMTTVYIEPGCPWQNGYGERFNGTVRDECLNMHVFQSVAEARVVLAAYRRQYNEERPHSSLGYRTPAEFKRDWLERQSLSSGLSHFHWSRLLGACHEWHEVRT
jgi:putative transposase